MKTVIIDESRKNEWERYLQENPDSIAWQSYEWSTVLRNHYRFDFHPIVVLDGSQIRGILPLYHMKNVFGKDMLISVPYAVAGGIVADNDEARGMLLDKAIELSRMYNSCGITLKQYKVRIDRQLRTDGNYYNRELDLTSGMDAIWNGLAETNREQIETSKNSAYKLEYPSADLDIFYNMLLTHHHGRGIPCVGREWIKDLIGFKMYSLAVLKLNGSVVAATMIKEFKDTVSFPFTCVPDKQGKTGVAEYRLYWELISRFASEGKRIFHSGRIPRTDQTDPYRLGWGGVQYDYYYQYYPDSSTTTTEYAKRKGRKRDLFESCWKKMPLTMAGFLGPRIVKHFP
jgi:hypothetical protein